jgi:hypothetical protein
MNLFKRLFARHEASPERLLPQLPDEPDWFNEENRLPYPAWERIALWINGAVDAGDRDEAWNQAVRMWAAMFPVLREGRIMIAESPEFILMTTLEPSARRWALQTLESAHRAIVNALGELAWTVRRGKRTVFLLPERLYARYTSAYYEDDYMGRSAGVFLSGRGYPHIAASMPAGDHVENSVQRTLTHELTHFALSALQLPRWLDEALAMHFEDQLAGGEPALADRLGSVFEAITTTELLREFRGWWTEEKMQGFWHGDLWNSEEDEQSLCYEMSRQIFRVLRQAVDGAPQHFRAFIGGAADAEDAGQASAREHLGFSPGQLAAQILGEGNWEPRAFR